MNSIIILIAVSLFFLILIHVIFLWVHLTAYKRIERLFYFLFWPLLLFSLFAYLWRIALYSFFSHGRHLPTIRWGWYELGELFSWKHAELDDDILYVSTRLRRLYDRWLIKQNSIFFDPLAREQDVYTFFRWGTFVRYLYLFFYYSFCCFFFYCRRFICWSLGAELGHSLALFFIYISKYIASIFSYTFWVFFQFIHRVFFVLGGEAPLLVVIRFFRLERLLGFQWHQQSNVDETNSPFTAFAATPSNSMLRQLWFFLRWQKRWNLPTKFSLTIFFSHFIFFLFCSFILFPLTIVVLLLLTFLGLIEHFQYFYYKFLRKSITIGFFRSISLFLEGYALQGLWLFFSTIYTITSFIYFFPYIFIHSFLFLWRIFIKIGSILLIFLFFFFLSKYDLLSFFQFSVRYNVLEILTSIVQSIPGYNYNIPLIAVDPGIPELSNLWHRTYYDEYKEFAGYAYHGGWIRGVPLRRLPHSQVPWWKRPECAWYWTRPLPVLAQNSEDHSFLERFYDQMVLWRHYILQGENISMNRARKWMQLLRHWEKIKDIAWRTPYEPLYFIVGRFYRVLSITILLPRHYYWINYAYLKPAYLLCVILSFFYKLTFIWTARFFFWMLLFFASNSKGLYLIIFVFSYVLQLLWLLLVIVLFTLSQGLILICKESLNFFKSALVVVFPFTINIYKSFTFSFSYTPIGFLEYRWNIFDFYWNAYVRWYFWLFALILWEFEFYWREFPFNNILEFIQTVLHFLNVVWPWLLVDNTNFPFVDRWTNGWSTALASYLWIQRLIDKLCLYVQLPRYLDDYTLFSQLRRLRKAIIFRRQFASRHKGAMGTGHHWLLSPLAFFQYLCQGQSSMFDVFFTQPINNGSKLLPSYLRNAFAEGPINYEDWIFNYLPFLIVDAHYIFVVFGPLTYYPFLLLLFLGCPGFAKLLSGKPFDDPFLNHQEAWLQCRNQSLESIESMFYFPKPFSLVTRTPFAGSSAYRLLSTKIYKNFLERYHLPPFEIISPKLRKQSLGRGLSYDLFTMQSDNALALNFSNYLLLDKYSNLRRNINDLGDSFTLFLAYFYRRNPWIPLCVSIGEEEDDNFVPWPTDRSLNLAEQSYLSGLRTRFFLERANSHFFGGNLGNWLWHKEAGNFQVHKIANEDTFGSLAYEFDDPDRDANIGWSFVAWTLCLPLSLLTNFYYNLENSWSDWAIAAGILSNESRRLFLLEQTFFGHFYFFHSMVEMRGWSIIPEWMISDTPVSMKEDHHNSSYPLSWDDNINKSPLYAFYPCAINSPYYSMRWTFFYGSSYHANYFSVLSERFYFRFFLFILLMIFLFFCLYPKKNNIMMANQTTTTIYGRPTNFFYQRCYIKIRALWFWK